MIVVDSSVWIANLRNQPIASVRTLWRAEIADDVLVGDIVLAAVLQGARDETHAARLEADLRRLPIVIMVGEEVAAKAARHYRHLRAAGVTMSKLADLFIGTFCIEHGAAWLHCDADFEPMARLRGLRCMI